MHSEPSSALGPRGGVSTPSVVLNDAEALWQVVVRLWEVCNYATGFFLVVFRALRSDGRKQAVTVRTSGLQLIDVGWRVLVVVVFGTFDS